VAHHIFIQGPLGSGKTFTMSLLAHYWRNKVRLRGGDVMLFSNYGLLDSYPMDHYTDWYEVARAQGSICCWDEAQHIADSRQALKRSSVAMTKLLMYVRKMRSVQIYCSPSIQNVDSRIRQLVEVLINVRRVGDKGLSLDFYDYQARHYGTNGRFLHSQFIPRSKMERIFRLKLYDTFEMVQGFPMPVTERQEKEFFETLERIHDEARMMELERRRAVG